MKILIKDGFIVDGSGNEGYKGDVLIFNERIEKICNKIDEENVDEIIDVKGLIIVLGFIDIYLYSDFKILENLYNVIKIK